ncbi:MAG: glycosyltransferase family 4 protein, partial [Gammaproteobacteria bacterium]|nr:glycosyltransferase family 4 protein [Gammaproteobacteria bacterium]
YTLHQIGLVANIRPIKRMGDLIKALKLVRKDFPDATVVIVGGGDEKSLISLAEEYGVQDGVRFVGSQSNVSDYIKDCQIMALCSESEGLSNAIMEYMAHQKPVICSDVGGNGELVEHGNNGFLYPMGDVNTLAKYLVSLLQDTQQAETFGANGFEKIMNVFSVEQMIENTLNIYRKITTS